MLIIHLKTDIITTKSSCYMYFKETFLIETGVRRWVL